MSFQSPGQIKYPAVKQSEYDSMANAYCRRLSKDIKSARIQQIAFGIFLGLLTASFIAGACRSNISSAQRIAPSVMAGITGIIGGACVYNYESKIRYNKREGEKYSVGESDETSIGLVSEPERVEADAPVSFGKHSQLQSSYTCYLQVRIDRADSNQKFMAWLGAFFVILSLITACNPSQASAVRTRAAIGASIDFVIFGGYYLSKHREIRKLKEEKESAVFKPIKDAFNVFRFQVLQEANAAYIAGAMAGVVSDGGFRE